MKTQIYIKYNCLPASQIAEQQLEKAKEVYELTRQQIQEDLYKAELEFEKERDEFRKNIKWIYSVTLKQNENKGTLFFTIIRKAENPLPGDEYFCQDIIYRSFQVINYVVIMDGSGYCFKQVDNGSIIQPHEYEQLLSGIVPDIFKSH